MKLVEVGNEMKKNYRWNVNLFKKYFDVILF